MLPARDHPEAASSVHSYHRGGFTGIADAFGEERPDAVRLETGRREQYEARWTARPLRDEGD